MHDLESGATRDLLQTPAGRALTCARLSKDGRWLAYLETPDESDIWMATLPPAASSAR